MKRLVATSVIASLLGTTSMAQQALQHYGHHKNESVEYTRFRSGSDEWYELHIEPHRKDYSIKEGEHHLERLVLTVKGDHIIAVSSAGTIFPQLTGITETEALHELYQQHTKDRYARVVDREPPVVHGDVIIDSAP